MPASGNNTPEIIQIAVVAMNQLGMVPQSIADIAGCARTTVAAILNNAEIVAKYTNHEVTNQLKKTFPDRIFAKANAVLANINPDCPKMSEAQKATVFGILFDKYRISTDQATHIIDFQAVSAKLIDIDAKMAEKEAQLMQAGVIPKRIENKP